MKSHFPLLSLPLITISPLLYFPPLARTASNTNKCRAPNCSSATRKAVARFSREFSRLSADRLICPGASCSTIEQNAIPFSKLQHSGQKRRCTKSNPPTRDIAQATTTSADIKWMEANTCDKSATHQVDEYTRTRDQSKSETIQTVTT